MEATARSKQRYILMSHRKLRRVVNQIRGKAVPEAMSILQFMPYFASGVVLKNLQAAVSNAEQKYGELATPERLVISAVMGDEGPAYKRFRPRAQGRVYKIEKPTAHLTVEVKVKTKEQK
jgi:large subunit ribosomal protein L22